MYKFLNYYNSLCSGINTPAIFSYDPYITAIRQLLVHELQQIVYYIEKLKDYDVDMKKYTDKVIEFISMLIVNLDFKKESFFIIIEDLYNNKKTLEKLYISACEKMNTKPELLLELNLSSHENILKALNDKQLNIQSREEAEINKNKKNLYEIIINMVLNACNCLIELKNYNEDFEEAKNQVLKLLNSSNFPSHNESDLINIIKNFSKCNYSIMKKLYELTAEKYGPVIQKEVEIGQKQGRGILVSGESLIDLEKILSAAKDLNIKVYTHYEMINAFKFSKFGNYKNLACHYKKSNNNFPLDFASFPGPIYISRNSISKVDLIRGQIYTSAKYPPFGIGKIENDDFTPLIEYALDAKGFENNSHSETVVIGYDLSTIKEKIELLHKKILNNTVNKIFIIGEIEYFNSNNSYLEEFIKNQPENTFILLFSNIKFNDSNKIFRINSYYDFPILYRILEELKEKNPNITDKIGIYLTDCGTNTISHIFNLLQLNIKNIYLSSCCPNIINPALIECLNQLFNVKNLTTPKDDFKF